MIHTVTLNPCFDLTLMLESFSPEDVNRTVCELREPAGKGLSVARAVRAFGVPVTAYVLAGERDIDEYRVLAGDTPGTLELFPVGGGIRENLTLCPPGAVYKVNRPARPPELGSAAPTPADGLCTLKERLLAAVCPEEWVVLSGSLPPELSKSDFMALCVSLKEAGVRLCLDCDFLTLEDLGRLSPWMIKPNEFELRRLAGEQELECALSRVTEAGAGQVLLSMGGDGVWLHSAAFSLRAAVPPVAVQSTVCAGDSVMAGYLCALSRGQVERDALVLAAACGTVTVTKPGSGIFTEGEAREMAERVQVSKLL